MKAAPVAAANSRLRKIERSSIGALPRCSIRTKSGSSTPETSEAADHQRCRPSRRCRRARSRRRARSGRRRRSGSRRRSRPRTLSRAESSRRISAAQARAGQGQRHVEPEDPVPGDRDQGAAEHRAEDEADRGDHRVGPHRQPQLLAREGVGDQGRAVGEDEGAADPLQDPPEDQLGAVGGEAGAERGERRRRRRRRRRPSCGRTGPRAGRR